MELTIRPDQSARIRQGILFEGSRQRLTGREQELIQLWQSRVVVDGNRSSLIAVVRVGARVTGCPVKL